MKLTLKTSSMVYNYLILVLLLCRFLNAGFEFNSLKSGYFVKLQITYFEKT